MHLCDRGGQLRQVEVSASTARDPRFNPLPAITGGELDADLGLKRSGDIEGEVRRRYIKGQRLNAGLVTEVTS